MRNLIQKRVLFIMILCLSGMFCQQAEAATNGWKNNCYYVDGKKQTSKWIQDGKDLYYVDSKGKKVTGWEKIGSNYYFFNAKGNNHKTGKKSGVKITKLSKSVITKGIDASQYQGNVDWQKVKEAGVNFVMLRVGSGAGRNGSKKATVDKRFEEYVQGANDAGIAIGIYLYSYATTAKQALSEAEFVIEQLQGVPVSFPVAYDVEDAYILKNTTKKQRTENAKIFMDTIAAAGYYPMYYCNQSWYNSYLDVDELEEYDFWYARYTHVEPSGDEYPFTMWQATSTQKLSGITENTVDINFLYKDYFDQVKTRNHALKYGWHTEGGQLRYYYQGDAVQSGWFSFAGNRYYFSNKAAVTGLRTIDNEKYYFDQNGVMQTGFVKVGGKRYLFDENGIMQTKTDEPGVTIDADGVCHIEKGWYTDSNGRYFYRNSDGNIAKNKWITTNGKKYYVGSNGRRVIGLSTIKGNRYYFDKNGVMKTGWLKRNGRKYYFKKNGQMVIGKTIRIKGKKYTFSKSGYLK